MTTLIWWVRRDLRLSDNTALHAALSQAEHVIPVFVLDDRLLKAGRLDGPRTAWMLDGLRALDADLRQHGTRLILRRGSPAAELRRICAESGARGVYFNRDYSPYAIARDEAVSAALREVGCEASAFKDLVIHEAAETATKEGSPYEVYTPYRRAWALLPKLAVLSEPRLTGLRATDTLESLPIPTPDEYRTIYGVMPVPMPVGSPGEREARARLEAFTQGQNAPIYRYGEQRNLLAVEGTSALSPYLRWGMVSIRQCYWAARAALDSAPTPAARASAETWIAELVWREFNYQILARNPHIVRRNFRPAYDAIAWENNPAWLAAWSAGLTGYPVVDAAMRQLSATGWMHNRARMIAASFLCKDLLIDWRLGERVFMQRLLDGDAANNVGGWQWTAGTGTDAAPYFRIFNPVSQAQKFDPDGVYIRRWLPELANVPTKLIHQPWEMTAQQQVEYGCVIGRDYPAPIVDHAVQRERALALYAAAKATSPNRPLSRPSS